MCILINSVYGSKAHKRFRYGWWQNGSNPMPLLKNIVKWRITLIKTLKSTHIRFPEHNFCSPSGPKADIGASTHQSATDCREPNSDFINIELQLTWRNFGSLPSIITSTLSPIQQSQLLHFRFFIFKHWTPVCYRPNSRDHPRKFQCSWSKRLVHSSVTSATRHETERFAVVHNSHRLVDLLAHITGRSDLIPSSLPLLFSFSSFRSWLTGQSLHFQSNSPTSTLYPLLNTHFDETVHSTGLALATSRTFPFFVFNFSNIVFQSVNLLKLHFSKPREAKSCLRSCCTFETLSISSLEPPIHSCLPPPFCAN